MCRVTLSPQDLLIVRMRVCVTRTHSYWQTEVTVLLSANE